MSEREEEERRRPSRVEVGVVGEGFEEGFKGPFWAVWCEVREAVRGMLEEGGGELELVVERQETEEGEMLRSAVECLGRSMSNRYGGRGVSVRVESWEGDVLRVWERGRGRLVG